MNAAVDGRGEFERAALEMAALEMAALGRDMIDGSTPREVASVGAAKKGAGHAEAVIERGPAVALGVGLESIDRAPLATSAA